MPGKVGRLGFQSRGVAVSERATFASFLMPLVEFSSRRRGIGLASLRTTLYCVALRYVELPARLGNRQTVMVQHCVRRLECR